MYRLLVGKTASFNDYQRFENRMVHFLFNKKPHEVLFVKGLPNSDDSFIEQFAKEKGCLIHSFDSETKIDAMIMVAERTEPIQQQQQWLSFAESLGINVYTEKY